MKKEILIACISSVATGILGFVALVSIGALDKKIEDNQIKKVVASVVADDYFLESTENTLVKLAEKKVSNLEKELSEIKTQIGSPLEWPHAINCGVSWDAIFIAHGIPIEGQGLTQYNQVYAEESRYVRFNPDGSFHDRNGHDDSSKVCVGRSIKTLRKEGRTFQFLRM